MIGPSDLVALVSFDGRVTENQAMTRDRLGRPQGPPHALGTALKHWMRRQHFWMEVAGRQIQGIATARELGSPSAWEIDTLIDASAEDEDAGSTQSLLTHALKAAADHKVSHLLFRVADGAPVLPEALAAGFTPAVAERLWRGVLRPRAASESAYRLRPLEEHDAHSQFQLYCRALPAVARQALAMTFEEWTATREHGWLGRGARGFAVGGDGRMHGALYVDQASEGLRFELVADEAEPEAMQPLLDAAAEAAGTSESLALIPESATALQSALADRGLQPADSYVLLCRRLSEAVRDASRARARTPIPSGG